MRKFEKLRICKHDISRTKPFDISVLKLCRAIYHIHTAMNFCPLSLFASQTNTNLCVYAKATQ